MLLYARRLNRDDGGVILLTFEDITERERTTETLRKREEWIKNVLETDAVGVLFFDQASGTLVDANNAFLKMAGYDRKQVDAGALTWRDMTPEEWVEVSERQMEKLSATGLIGPYEKEYLHKDGSRSWMVFTGRSLGNGTVIEYCFDISDHIRERKEGEKQRELLLAELSHRVKNMLAVVQSLASQTLARSKSLEDFGRTFRGRLDAVARSHNQLLCGEWKSAELRKLVKEAVSAFGPDRVRVRGPALNVSAKAALSLSLVLHELETNSAKYGALSAEGGSIDVTWTGDETGHVHMIWQESGGPPVSPPDREGFGTRLIRQLVEYDLGGAAGLDFKPDGMRGELTFPANRA